MTFLKSLTWQAVTLILGGMTLFALILLLAPPDLRPYLFGVHGLVSTVLGLASDWRRKPALSDPDRTPTDPGGGT